MSAIYLIITIAIVGLLVWAITTYIPMNDAFKRMIVVVGVVVCAVMVLVWGMMQLRAIGFVLPGMITLHSIWGLFHVNLLS